VNGWGNTLYHQFEQSTSNIGPTVHMPSAKQGSIEHDHHDGQGLGFVLATGLYQVGQFLNI
jgi:hypothetical protein